jgi:hypothetical protein
VKWPNQAENQQRSGHPDRNLTTLAYSWKGMGCGQFSLTGTHWEQCSFQVSSAAKVSGREQFFVSEARAVYLMGGAGPTVLRTGRQREEYDVAPLRSPNFAGSLQFLQQTKKPARRD